MFISIVGLCRQRILNPSPKARDRWKWKTSHTILLVLFQRQGTLSLFLDSARRWEVESMMGFFFLIRDSHQFENQMIAFLVVREARFREKGKRIIVR